LLKRPEATCPGKKKCCAAPGRVTAGGSNFGEGGKNNIAPLKSGQKKFPERADALAQFRRNVGCEGSTKTTRPSGRVVRARKGRCGRGGPLPSALFKRRSLWMGCVEPSVGELFCRKMGINGGRGKGRVWRGAQPETQRRRKRGFGGGVVTLGKELGKDYWEGSKPQKKKTKRGESGHNHKKKQLATRTRKKKTPAEPFPNKKEK